MRVQYEYSRQANDRLHIYHEDDVVGVIENGMVVMRFNDLVRLIESAHLEGKIDSPLIISRIKKGQKEMQA